MKNALLDCILAAPRRLAAPLAGFPACQLTSTSLRDNYLDPQLHTRSILMLAEQVRPDIVFPMMNLSIEAGALGMPVNYPENESPTVTAHRVDENCDLVPFREIDIFSDSHVQNHLQVVKGLSEQSDLPICAYTAGPYTLAGLLMSAMEISMATLEDPERVHDVLDVCTGVIVRYAKALEAAGADAICMLDPTAMMLSPSGYDEFAGGSVKEAVKALSVPVILHVCGDTTHLIEDMAATGVQALSLDYAVNFAQVAGRVPEDVVLMGNIDPVNVMRSGTPASVASATQELLDSVPNLKNFLPSNGCDLPPDTPIENITAFNETIKNWTR